jgi:hypothetical protein
VGKAGNKIFSRVARIDRTVGSVTSDDKSDKEHLASTATPAYFLVEHSRMVRDAQAPRKAGRETREGADRQDG